MRLESYSITDINITQCVDGFKNYILHVKILFKKIIFLVGGKRKKEEHSRKHVTA